MVFAGNQMVQDLRQLEKEIVLFPIMIVLSLNQTGRHILNNTNDHTVVKSYLLLWIDS